MLPCASTRSRWRPRTVILLCLTISASAGAETAVEPTTVERNAGEASDLVLDLGPAYTGTGILALGPVGRTGEDRAVEGILVGLAAETEPLPERWPDDPLPSAAPLPSSGQSSEVRIRILVHPCAETGEYWIPIKVRRGPPGAVPQSIARLHLRVAPSRHCARRRALAGLAAVVPLLLGFWWFQAARNSHFLPLERLDEALVPQVYDIGHEAEDSERDLAVVRGQLRSQLGPWRRLGAWLRAWWKGGFSWIPRGPYEETVLLRLERRPRLGAILEPTLRAGEALREEPDRAAGYLILRATRDRAVRVSAVPDGEGRVAGLTLERPGGGAVPGHWVDLDRRFALRPAGGRQDAGAREPAGWEVRPV